MKKHSGTLILITHALGLLIVGGLCFMGCIYIFKDSIISQVIALITIIALFFIVYWLSGTKQRQTNKGFTLTEGIGLVAYLGVAWLTLIAISHYINVEFLLKDEIKAIGTAKLKELNDMVVLYEEKVGEVNDRLSSEIDVHISRYTTTNGNYPLKDSLADFAINFTRASDLNRIKNSAIEGNYAAATQRLNRTKEETLEFIRKKQSTLDRWDRTHIHDAFQQIDNKLAANLEILREEFKASPNNKKWNENTFDVELSERQDKILSDPATLKKNANYSQALPLLTAFIAHLLILLPYLATGRNGTKRIYPKKGSVAVGGIEM